MDTPTFEPIRILELELSQPLPRVTAVGAATGHRYQRAIALVRLQHQPIGVMGLYLDENGIKAAAYTHQIWRAPGPEVKEYLRKHRLPGVAGLDPVGLPGVGSPREGQVSEPLLANAPPVSIIVATRDRTESLAICLRSLLALDYPSYEVLVVDNAPSSTATADFIRQEYGDSPQVRYLLEGHPGLAIAHNRGLRQVTTPIVAFTDDDVVVDRYWLTELVKGFSVAENVGCVTGMIFPAELETQSQLWTEQYWGLCKGFTRRVFDLHQNRPQSPLYPYAAGAFGSGANMAFETSVLRRLGGFDNALGAGSRARGGDDLAAFFQVITAGYTLVYQPAAMVYHRHRRDYVGLRQQAYGYGVGLTAYLTKALMHRPLLLFDFIFKAPYGLFYAFNAKSTKGRDKPADYPKELKNLERKGMVYGPFAYLRSRWQTRKLKQRFGPVEGPEDPGVSRRTEANEAP